MTYSSLTVDTASSFSIQTCAGIFSHLLSFSISPSLSLSHLFFPLYVGFIVSGQKEAAELRAPSALFQRQVAADVCVCVRECVTGGCVCACVCVCV